MSSLSPHCLAFTRASIVTYLNKQSLLSTWSHGRHVGVPKQSNGDHALVLWEFNSFVMQTQYIFIAAGPASDERKRYGGLSEATRKCRLTLQT